MKDFSVYIRPLRIEDAEVSYKWRNNQKIWRYTGSRPNKIITPEIEKGWLEEVLQRTNEKRFAICLKDSNTYIGNVFLTDIDNESAIIHIFIGDIENWGKRRALEAMALLLDDAFITLAINQVYGLIDKNNVLSTNLAKLLQCKPVESYEDQKTNKQMIRWLFDRGMFEKKNHMKALEKWLASKGI